MVKPQAKFDIEMMTALEAELQQELAVVKEQLVASETGKAEALREFANMKSLLNELLLVEHFAAVDAVAVPLPPNWSDGLSGQLDAGNLEIDRLRREVEASAAELERAKQEIAWLKADLNTAQDLTAELKDEIRKLQPGEARRLQETSSIMELSDTEMISRHEASAVVIQSNNIALQADLKTLRRRLHETTTTELQNPKQEIAAIHADYETILSDPREALSKFPKRNVEAEIRKLQGESTTAKGSESTEEENKTNLEVVIGQYYSTCTELTGKINKFGGECEALRVKYESFSSEHNFHLVNREEHGLTIANLRRLQAEVAALKDEKLTETAALASQLDALHVERRKSEAKYRETVTSLQAQIGDLKAQLRDSVHECLVSTKSQLQKVRIELAIVKEVLEWVSGDAAALSAELEAIRLQLPYCLTSLPQFVGSWMKQFERDCWIKAAVKKMKALEVELKSLCRKQVTQICQVEEKKEPESSNYSDEEVLETYFAELQVNALEKKSGT